MYIIVSSFEIIKPEHCQDFIKAALQNGRNSRLHEPGTRRFELVQDERNPNLFYLSEAYEDKAAFEAHKKGRFYQDFFADISGYYTPTELVSGTLISSSDEKNENLNGNLKAVYQQLCDGSVRTENKIQSGEPSCGILTVIEPIFIRSNP